MRIIQYQQIKICYLEDESNYCTMSDRYSYVIARTESHNYSYAEELLRDGFRFHDRTIRAEIPLSRLDPMLERAIRFPVAVSTSYDTFIREISHQAFVRDRRFHLDLKYDQQQANILIDGYLKEYEEAKLLLIRCTYKEQTAGFVVIRDCGNGECENVLGAVRPEYQSKGVALSLYAWMVRYLSEQNYQKLFGYISTANPASLNLHIRLGATLGQSRDYYILDTSAEKGTDPER